jgi:signal transduction histidine kinase/ligand-binding sensor domain-containing protein/DNA-binding response OmpR family regulator
MKSQHRSACWLLLALFLLAPAVSSALDPGRPIDRYGVDVWLTDQGLPQNTVLAAAQTADGYLWLSTQTGLARFDGVGFRLFLPREHPGLGKARIEALLADRAGRLWIGTRQGLAVYERGRFSRAALALSSMGVHALLEDRDGVVWIGTDRGLGRLKDGRLHLLTTAAAVTAICRDGAGGLWIGTEKGGVVHLGAGRPARLAGWPASAEEPVTALAMDREGTLWIGTHHGLGRLRSGQLTVLTQSAGLPSDEVFALLPDRDGNLWIGSLRGLSRLRDGRLESLSGGTRLADDDIRALLEDREGSLWIGTASGGLNRLKDTAAVALAQPDGQPYRSVWSLFPAPDGSLWMGTDRGALHVEGGRITSFTERDGLPTDVVRAVMQDRQGDVWMGTAAGLARLHDGRVEVFTTAQGLPDLNVISLYEDRDGRLWAGTAGGLALWRAGRFVAILIDGGPQPWRVYAIQQDRQGTLWVGTTLGLYRLSSGRLVPFERGSALQESPALVIHEDRQGGLWIGTGEMGLYLVRGGKVSAFRAADGLPDDTIVQILEDAGGDLWVSCNHGIFRLRRTDVERFAADGLRPLPVLAYGSSDGMKNAEGRGGAQPGAVALPDGRLLFPMMADVAVVRPGSLPFNELPPPVKVQELVAAGRNVPLTDAIRLAPEENDLELRYAALSFLAPGKVKFLYRLEGFDTDWVDAGARRSAYYTRLPPGSYRFRVKACNNDGVWSPEGASVAVEIVPHTWQTWWFRSLSAFLLVAGVFGSFRLRIHHARTHARTRETELLTQVVARTKDLQEERDRAEQARLEAERARQEAEQADRAKSEFLANMSHEIRTPMNAVIGMTSLLLGAGLPPQHREHVETIRASGEGLLALLNDILDFSKVSAGRLELAEAPFDVRACVDDVVDLHAAAAAAKKVGLRRQVDSGVPHVVVSDSSRVRQILINLVSNALKFTSAGEIVVAVSAGAVGADGLRELRFSVSDTGIGIPPERLDRLFKPFSQADASTARHFGGTGLGLAISRNLAEILGGGLWVESEPGRGSVFHFQLRCREEAPTTLLETQPFSLESLRPMNLPPGLRILVAEDNTVNQKVALLMLERLGYRADVAADGFEALAALRRQSYDVVLMDVQMPGMDGLEAARRIRAEWPEHRPYVVAVTAHALLGDREACLAAGMDDYLSKPLRIEDMRAALMRMGMHSAARAATPPKPVALLSFDPVPLKQLRELEQAAGREIIATIVESFLTETPLRIEKMREAMETGDAKTLHALAHSLKGSGAQLGAVRFAALCRDVEGAALDSPAVSGLLAALAGELERLEPILRAEAGGAARV